MRMPGWSGVDLQSCLNAEDYQIPIIFITAHGDEKMRVRAMRDGAVAFLAKPFDNSVLLDRVRACLKGTKDDDLGLSEGPVVASQHSVSQIRHSRDSQFGRIVGSSA